MNKAQQAYFAEKNAFATSVNALGIGIKTETTSFKYSVRATKKAAFNYAVGKENPLKVMSVVFFWFLLKTLSQMLLKRK
jgi:type IV pilus assembly protein PilA